MVSKCVGYPLPDSCGMGKEVVHTTVGLQITGEDGASVVVDVHLRTSGAELVAVYD